MPGTARSMSYLQQRMPSGVPQSIWSNQSFPVSHRVVLKVVEELLNP